VFLFVLVFLGSGHEFIMFRHVCMNFVCVDEFPMFQ
jgi:hypothetical protein